MPPENYIQRRTLVQIMKDKSSFTRIVMTEDEYLTAIDDAWRVGYNCALSDNKLPFTKLPELNSEVANSNVITNTRSNT